MARTYTLLLAILLPLLSVTAQSTAGTEFWLGYMENLNIAFNDQPAFSVVISADAPTAGSIDVPATGLNLPFNVPLGSTEIFLPDAIFYSQGSEQIDDRGIRITAESPVRVQAFHYRLYFSESSNLLPTGELGTDYLVTTILSDGGFAQPASLVVVATADNTEVEITPTALTLGLRPAGVPFTITLDEGENYQIQALGELSGTRVRSLSGQAIAVFSGAQQANIFDGTCAGGADSHVWDQSLPLDDWRDLYYFVPFSGQGGDRIRIVAAADNTRVFFDCEEVALLNTGEFYESFLTDPTVITSTEAISLTQYTNSYSCEPTQLGDPNGLSYLPADFRADNFRWYASGRTNALAESGRHFDRHFATIVGPADATSTVLVDGGAINGFMPFPANPDWEYAQVQLGAGNHEITATGGVQVYSYGFGFADSYTSHLGYTQVTPEAFACLEIEREGVLCVDSLQQFTYTSNLDLVDFAWDFGDGGVSNTPEPTYAYNTAGTYEVTLTATDAMGLVVSATLQLTVVDCSAGCSDLPPLTILGPTEVCVDTTQFYGASTTADLVSYSWFGAGQTSEFNLFSVTFDAPSTSTISLSALDAEGCVYTATLEVVAADCPDDCADLGLNDLAFSGTFCLDSTFSITANYESNIAAEEVWTILGPDFDFVEGVVINQDAFSEAGSYELNFLAEQLGSGCFVDTTIIVTITECIPDCELFTITDIAISGTACVDSLVTADAMFSSPPDSLSWLINSLPSAEGNPLEQRFSDAGMRTIQLQAFWDIGCSVDTTLTLSIEDCPPPIACKVMLPNIFSPNNDGVNDGFRPFFSEACEPAVFTLEIYNRWGDQVYQSSDPAASWDGRFLGKPHPQDVLIYWSQITFSDGTMIEKKGDVTLVR